MDNKKLFEVIELLGNNLCDGHFTIMKFTTNWRVCFGFQPQTREDIQHMPEGKTLEEAFINALVDLKEESFS